MEESLSLKLGVGPALVFLCHNKLDKPFVREIADALELETGTPIFLDVFAIPVGEAFLPAIETALDRSTGCAIFLGANGWGPTHFWEAEKALSRYRTDRNYRLLPVALPGLKDEDAGRLGAGTLFRTINWADFRQGPRDSEALGKLLAAIAGTTADRHRGPMRLTPYQLRRDAGRWQGAKTAREKTSILYRGAQLTEAEAIVAQSPDYAVLDEIAPFLLAAQHAARSRLRRWIVGAGLVTFVTSAAAVAAVISYLTAEARRLESTSRELAIVSRDAPRPDNQLLIAVSAVDAAETPEARGNLVALLENWRHLTCMTYLDSGVEALGAGKQTSAFLAGKSDGGLVTITPGGTAEPQTILPSHAGATVTAVLPLTGRTVVGHFDGSVEAVSAAGAVTQLLPPRDGPATKDQRILALSADAKGDILAAGGADGSLRLVSLHSGEALASLDLFDKLRVTALAFDSTGRRLAVGTGSLDLFIVDVANPKALQITDTYPTRYEGEPLAVGFNRQGNLVLIGSLALSRFDRSTGELIRQESSLLETGFVSAAAIGGDANIFAIGDRGGYVAIDGSSAIQTDFGRVRGHAGPVTSLAFSETGEALVSGSGDGSVAMWDVTGGRDLSQSHAPPPGQIVALSLDGGVLLAATNDSGGAHLWRRRTEEWDEALDLSDASRRALGDAAFDAPVPAADAAGFTEIGEDEIPAVALSSAGAVVWTTRTKALLWQHLHTPRDLPLVLSRSVGDKGMSIAISADGQTVAWLQGDGRMVGLSRIGGGAVPTVALPDATRTLALDPAGNHLAAGLQSGGIALVRVGEAAPYAVVSAHRAPVAGLSFTEDGATLVSYGAGGGGSDNSVAIGSLPRLSDLAALITRLPGGAATALAVGRNTDLLAVGDQDGQVLLWSASNKKFVSSLPAGGLWIPALVFDDAQRTLWVAGSDGRLLSWNLDGKEAVILACRKANRSLAAGEWASLRPDDAYMPLCSAEALSEAERSTP